MTTNKKITINTINDDYDLEIYHLTRLFFPSSTVKVDHKQIINDKVIINQVEITTLEKQTFNAQTNQLFKGNQITYKRKLKRYAKQCVYQALLKHTGTMLPWGCLTGVRPTRVAYDLIEEGTDISVLKETMEKEFFVSPSKAKLVYETIKNQKSIIKNEHLISLYINIPVCPSRCSYCSFISSSLSASKDILPKYVETLIEEIRQTKKMLYDKAYVVRTIYIGGGTPTVLSAQQLDMLLSELSYPVSEFTVECGRADTISEEKLIVLKKHGVTRICINPQTFVQKTLKLIGRTHTNEQVFSAYMLAVKHGFVVNMDFIAGLEDETVSNFKKTMNIAMELSPQNITIHTLFLKNKTQLEGKDELLENRDKRIESMINYSYDILSKNGYKPYYLYRQKNQLEGLENVGYAQDGKICLFNIDTMEETLGVVACGANAISKRVRGKNQIITRYQNAKTLLEYTQKIDEICAKKKQLFD